MSQNAAAPAAGEPARAPNAAEVARRVLKTLADRRVIPTPDSFSQVYFEITGQRAGGATPTAVLREVLKDLVRNERITQQEAAAAFEAGNRSDWAKVREAMDKALARRAGGASSNWPQAALAMLRQADALHANWTRARKVEAIARVIEGAAEHPETALERLQRLMESWGPAMAALPGAGAAPAAHEPAAVNQPAPAEAERPAAAAGTPAIGVDHDLEVRLATAAAAAGAWQQVALRALRLLENNAGEGSAAAQRVREFAAQNTQAVPAEPDKLPPRLTDVLHALERRLEEERKVRAGLQRLLALLCDNMKSLTPEEAWLAGQLEPIRALLSGSLQIDELHLAEVQLAKIIAQQGDARRGLQEAKLALKEMLASLVQRISSIGDSTGRFHSQIAGYEQELAGASDFETLSRVIRGLLGDTQHMRTDIEATRGELAEAKRKVEVYEQRVRHLEVELTRVSVLVQRDPLTTALNRRGLEEAFKAEVARAGRYSTPLTLALIDVDDFKRVNDRHGHINGDRALVLLANVVQAIVRPTDAFARLGGEEFVLLLPNAASGDGERVLVRIQQELARQPMDCDGVAVTLRFSAGVADWSSGESLEDLLARSDKGLYEAKHAGKNRVVIATR